MKSTIDLDAPCRLKSRFPDEAGMLQGMARRVTAESTDRGASRGEQQSERVVTVGALLTALRDDDMLRREAAAYVAGRCHAQDEDADASLTAAVDSALADANDPVLRIELAMAAALRGVAAGGSALRTAARERDPFAEPHKAAAYLASLGDPSGWPAIVRTAQGGVAHYRLMAVRAVLQFEPFAGRTIEGEVVDPKGRAVAALEDEDALVRAEVPAVLERLAIDDLEAVLRPVVNGDPSPEVKAAAAAVLDRRRPPSRSQP